jgi:hypothetical protein
MKPPQAEYISRQNITRFTRLIAENAQQARQLETLLAEETARARASGWLTTQR